MPAGWQGHIHISKGGSFPLPELAPLYKFAVTDFRRQKHQLNSPIRNIAGRFRPNPLVVTTKRKIGGSGPRPATGPRRDALFFEFLITLVIKDGTGDTSKPAAAAYDQYTYLADLSVRSGNDALIAFIPPYHEDDGEDHSSSVHTVHVVNISNPTPYQNDFGSLSVSLSIESKLN